MLTTMTREQWLDWLTTLPAEIKAECLTSFVLLVLEGKKVEQAALDIYNIVEPHRPPDDPFYLGSTKH